MRDNLTNYMQMSFSERNDTVWKVLVEEFFSEKIVNYLDSGCPLLYIHKTFDIANFHDSNGYFCFNP